MNEWSSFRCFCLYKLHSDIHLISSSFSFQHFSQILSYRWWADVSQVNHCQGEMRWKLFMEVIINIRNDHHDDFLEYKFRPHHHSASSSLMTGTDKKEISLLSFSPSKWFKGNPHPILNSSRCMIEWIDYHLPSRRIIHLSILPNDTSLSFDHQSTPSTLISLSSSKMHSLVSSGWIKNWNNPSLHE